ncbi:MAG: 30S ribosomal protein S3 [Clostridia bacterium]|nr:30S ribosomal protein S3 [Clostridia bacterium]MBR2472473.1 30S ribosomal protein S3 [Clostridia bacterium]MBR3865596.1 30S ribosomal protein S3 [Clostridia bacterium]
MGQKINPHGLRVGVIKGWDSRWFAKDGNVGDLLVEDYKIREYLKKKLYQAGVPSIEIERKGDKVHLFIHCARPGMIVGKAGADIEKLQAETSAFVGKPVVISIVEVRNPDLNAQLIAENIASQLEKRVSFRRAMKQVMGRAMKLGAKGIKTSVSGRLGGAEIARSEHYHEGTIPLQTLRADIDYGFAEAHTTYGRIGVKVWLYNGEVLTSGPRSGSVEMPKRDQRDRKRRDDRRDDRRGDRGGRPQGGERGGRFGERKQYSAGPRGPQGRPYQRPAAPAAAEAPKKEGEAE